MGLFDLIKKKELKEIERLSGLLEKYQPISNIEDEVRKTQIELDRIDNEKKKLSVEYESGLATYYRLKQQLALFESNLEFIEFGVYEPHYNFERSDQYREEQKTIIEKQKLLIKNKDAVVCTTAWTIGGDAKLGRKTMDSIQKLILRAFNGECSAMISNVKWNNIVQMESRLEKAYNDLNKLAEGFHISINLDYLKLKLEEMYLEHEFLLKKQIEKDAAREIQAELKEEEKARREFEIARRKAEKEEEIYENALLKARKEISTATGLEYEKLISKIHSLESDLAIVLEKKDRAISMAQQTKRGHVYIISNIGSFGEDVYKIGMTRRLDPYDRVRELGDASVPFKFDVHALIYSDNARTLEFELHQAFAANKVNMLNNRREFFRISLDEIKQKIYQLGFDAEFVQMAEAMEYRETLMLRRDTKLFNCNELSQTNFTSYLFNDDNNSNTIDLKQAGV
ncbi:T5orf172 domain-containing protein [Dyadobacter jejuensis]|uniref:T5orf172 domain-containing protein n=1 Tax=Dyadobacter jejuensis TaxID=1082580 RepID=A0A316AXX7_9BACT|nr:DUF4041 domain-containing protein [Dyadobacter jejuensis]PWJ55067.1 T5orf172 domain-containing protein [Dyadobacter jejuensis]